MKCFYCKIQFQDNKYKKDVRSMAPLYYVGPMFGIDDFIKEQNEHREILNPTTNKIEKILDFCGPSCVQKFLDEKE